MCPEGQTLGLGEGDVSLLRRRKAVEAMLGFAKKHGATLGGLDLKSMVHEGHKY